MRSMIRKVICLLLALTLCLTVPITARAATALPDSVYLTQEGSSTCTLCAAAMMIRARMYLSGSSQWTSVTESGIRSAAWIPGTGLKWGFTYELGGDRAEVSYAAVSGISADTLRAILEAHPEGIVLYCGNQPHAVFATDYENGTFYCAEPAAYNSGKRIPLVESWLGNAYPSQESILRNVTAYWYVSSYSVSGNQGGAPECGCTADYAGTYVCTAEEGSYLNIRSGHGTGYGVLGSIPSGAQVTVTKASGTGNSDWAHVVYNGISGYVSMGFLSRISATLEITKQPEHVTAPLGTEVSLSVEAVGDGLGYQWQWRAGINGVWSDTTVSGNTTDTVTMELTAGRSGCQYRCVITDRYGNTVISDAATLTAESTAPECDCDEAYAGDYICAVSAGSVLNIRSGHGTGYEAIGQIPAGAVVTVTKASGAGSSDWAHVVYNGISGYVSMGYLHKNVAPEGWSAENGSWYFYRNGIPVTGWLKTGGYWYYLDADGVMQTGWEKVNGSWYYLSKSGVMQTGWEKVNGYWYYLASGGAMQTGWQKINGKWYYLASGGAMQTGWLKTGGKWYYLGADGAMLTGTHVIDGKTYSFDATGAWIL